MIAQAQPDSNSFTPKSFKHRVWQRPWEPRCYSDCDVLVESHDNMALSNV